MHQVITKEEKVAFFDKLFEDNYTVLLRVARLALPKEDIKVIDDIVQRTFRQAWENVDELLTHHNPNAWLIHAVKSSIAAFSQDEKK
ncbi:MAG: hypothetical protein IJZ34_02430 [Lachnospiraceae bacterium]|nr:hypothetical protein [Lachnospiraceae bacterium]